MPWPPRLTAQRSRQAGERLAAALPDLPAREIPRLVRASWQQARDAVRHAGDAVLDPKRLCRGLELEGWGELVDAEQEAEARGSGVVLPLVPFGDWPLALAATALYRGRLALGPSLASWPGAEVLVGRSAITVEAVDDWPMAKLAAGQRLAVAGCQVAETVSATGSTRVDVPFLGTRLQIEDLPARLALATGAALVVVAIEPGEKGRRRLWARRIELPTPAVDSSGGSLPALTRAWLEPIEAAVRRRPELWPWFLSG